MKTRLKFIIILTALFFSPVASHALSSGSENGDHVPEHSKLSCLDCHGYIKEDPNHESAENTNASCLVCHEGSYEFEQNRQHSVNCLSCHSRHHEKVAHDTHAGVPCRACHQKDIIPVKINNNPVKWEYEPVPTEEYDPHLLITDKGKMCSRCHYSRNNMGAADIALPAKSIICMPCHAATLSIGDITSAIAIIIFLVGLSGIVVVWFSAGKGHEKKTKKGSINLSGILVTLVLDGLFQRRLLNISVKRWTIHAMIFFPFIIRFFWGIFALVLSLTDPDSNTVWAMLDKNNPFTGLLFDITGLSILAGGCLMFIYKRTERKKLGIKGLPENNFLAQILIMLIIVTGFIIEGVRISMTGSPDGSRYAFVGYIISRNLINYHLNGIYAYLWYLHAILTSSFIICLPFSRMFHVFLSPLSLIIKAATKD